MQRMPLTLFAGSTITVFLYFFLYTMISAGTHIFESEAPVRIEFQPLIVDKDVEKRIRIIKPREKPPEPPPPSGEIPQDPTEDVIVTPFDLAPSSGLLTDPTGIGKLVIGRGTGSPSITNPASADQQLMHLVRINPEYPEGPKMRGTEGYVVLEFTITTSGSVRDPRVLRAEPSRVFDRAAIQAVRRWKYSPQVENGQAVEKVQQIRLKFELPKGGARADGEED